MPELLFPDPQLADEVVALRPWRDEDVPAIVAGFHDPLVDQYVWRRADTYGEADARRFLIAQEHVRERGTELSFALADPVHQEVVIGGASLRVDQRELRASIGYWVAPEARGAGVATHTVKLLARWGFEDLGLGRIALTSDPANHGSQRVAARCGFLREGVLRAHMRHRDGRRDSVVFSMLPGELIE